MRDPLPGALTGYGWSQRVHTLYDDAAAAGASPGRVVRVERGGVLVAGPDGAEHPTRTPPTVPVAVGDWVAVAGGAVAAVLPRWSQLTRLDPDGHSLQVLAANIDVVLVTAPADRLSPARVERELLVAWDSGARPVVVLTKADLAGPDDAGDLRSRVLGVDVVEVSARTGAGVDEVRAALAPDRTAVLLGPSGAGKSTLVNLLVGRPALATGEVRAGDHRGRHTTTSRQLVPVPSGGVLIDTPGLRSLGLAGGGAEVATVFPDIDELAGGCRFDDCRHDHEPDCAVRAAADAGHLDPARLASFRKLGRELAVEARRADPLLRKAEVNHWKAVLKSVKANDKRRPR